jgi:hypothetical protein
LSELADYRKSTGTAMFLNRYSENIKLGIWSNPKESIQVAPKEKSRMTTPVSRHWKLGFEWTLKVRPAWDPRTELAEVSLKFTGTAQCSLLLPPETKIRWVGPIPGINRVVPMSGR